MTTSIFSIRRSTSRFRLVDRLIETVATRLLQHEVHGFKCPPNLPYSGVYKD